MQAGKEKNWKLAVWPTKMLESETIMHECEDTE